MIIIAKNTHPSDSKNKIVLENNSSKKKGNIRNLKEKNLNELKQLQDSNKSKEVNNSQQSNSQIKTSDNSNMPTLGNTNSTLPDNGGEEQKMFMNLLGSYYAQEQKFYDTLKKITETIGGNYHETMKEFSAILQKYSGKENLSLRADKFPFKFSIQRYNLDLENSSDVIEVIGLDKNPITLSGLENLYSFEDKKLDELLVCTLQLFSEAYKEALSRVMKNLGLPSQNIFKHGFESLCLFELLLSPNSQNILNNYFDVNKLGNLYVVFYTIEAMKKETTPEQANFQSQHDTYRNQIINKELSKQLVESIYPAVMQNPDYPLRSKFLLNFAAMNNEASSPEIKQFLESAFFTSLPNFVNIASPILYVLKDKYTGTKETYSIMVPAFNNSLYCSSSVIDLPQKDEKALKLIILFLVEVMKEIEKIVKEELHWRLISKNEESKFFNIPQTIFGYEGSKDIIDISVDKLDISEMRSLIEFMHYSFLHHFLKDIISRMDQYIESKFISQEEIRALEDQKINDLAALTNKIQASFNQTA